MSQILIVATLTFRVRVNEFNIEVVLAVFLPYQESPHFKKMLSILDIKCVRRFSLGSKAIFIITQSGIQILRLATLQDDL